MASGRLGCPANRNISEERTLEIALRNVALPDKAYVRFLVPRAEKFDERTFDRHDEELPIAANKRLAIRLPKGCIARIELGNLAARVRPW